MRHLHFSEYKLRWSLVRNDVVLQNGVLDDDLLHIPCIDSQTNQPGTATVQIPFALEEEQLLPGCEYFLNISVHLKADEGLLKAGHQVAVEQFVLTPELPEALDASEPLPVILCERTNGETILHGENFEIVFDEAQGRLMRFDANDNQGIVRSLIVPGEGPAGSFFRASTDNDRGFSSGLVVFTRQWKNPGEYSLESYRVEQAENGSVVITAEGSYPELGGMRLDTVYTVYGDGMVAADVSIRPAYDKTYVYIPVAGMQMTVPGEYEQLVYFGRGPEENYIDRSTGTKVGRYATTVTNNFVPYVESSETGNRTGVRWIALMDETGFGLLAAAGDQPIEVSALHYTANELDRAVHPHELNALENTILRLNAKQIGVGGDNSWDRIIPHEPYLPDAEEYAYSYLLMPLHSGEDAMEKSIEAKLRFLSDAE